MNFFLDIVSIVVACTMVNHLGLVQAIEDVIRHNIPIVDCPKCFTFWSTLVFCMVSGVGLPPCLAISVIASMTSIWLDLMLTVSDYYYIKVYETFAHSDSADSSSSSDCGDSCQADASDSLPKLRAEEKSELTSVNCTK